MGKRRVLVSGVVVGVLVVGVALGRNVGLLNDIPAGTGYAAWELCTRTEVSGLPFEQVRDRYVKPKVSPLPWVWDVEHQAGERVDVATILPSLRHPRTAVFREGLGCTVVPPGADESSVRSQRFVAVTERPASDEPWPGGEGVVQSALASAAARDVIARHAEKIFSESHDEANRRHNATALLVARDGHLIFERYGQGYTREKPQLGWSMTKTLTALVAGLMVTNGAFGLDAPVGLDRWKGTDKAAITWRALLTMAPGLAWFEGYGGASDATQMLFSEPDQGAWAADRPLTSAPGTVFNYSTGFTNIAMLAMKQRLGGTHQAIYDFYQQRLLAPLGIRGGVIEPDASGTPVGGARGMLRAVDWLRLGQLVEGGGRWGESQLIEPGYMRFLVAASAASPEYGGSIWRQPSDVITPELRPRLPEDLVFFAGHMEQYVIVVPSAHLVVLRMGVTQGPEENQAEVREQVFSLVADLISAG